MKKRGSNLRSQAALEFLTTYAWAFLVIIIMVGALAYFGVLSPTKLLPDRCNFGSEVGCNKDFMLIKDANTDTVNMRVESNFGSTVAITSLTATSDLEGLGTCTAKIDGNDLSGGAYTWNTDTTVDLAVDCTTATNVLVPKEKAKFQFEFNFYPVAAGTSYTKQTYGEILATVQP